MAYALSRSVLQTPLGVILIEGDADVISAIQIGGPPIVAIDDSARNSPVALAAQQLAEYFAGQRQDFDLPVARLRSERGMILRQGIASVPYGETRTYGGLAHELASAPRAVGQACRRNPLPIIIPCHRVTSSAGPEFYSGGDGPATKAWLINFEARYAGKEMRLL
jgi:methylated-DNA-[protein]-cysteine S-methyltransferase